MEWSPLRFGVGSRRDKPTEFSHNHAFRKDGVSSMY